MSNWRQEMPTPEAYWLDKVLFELHHNQDDLARYHADPQAYLDRFPLSDALKSIVTGNDVAGLYRAGVNPYLLRAHCIGMRIPEAESLAALRSVVE